MSLWRRIVFLLGAVCSMVASIEFFIPSAIEKHSLLEGYGILFLIAGVVFLLITWYLSNKYEAMCIFKKHKKRFIETDNEYWLKNSVDITEKYIGKNTQLWFAWFGLIKPKEPMSVADLKTKSEALIDECVNHVEYNGVYKSAGNNFLGGFTNEVLVPLLITVFIASVGGAFTIGLAVNEHKNVRSAEQSQPTTDSTSLNSNANGAYSTQTADLYSTNFCPNMKGIVKFCNYLTSKGYQGNLLLQKWNHKPFNNRLKLANDIRKMEELADKVGYKEDLWGIGKRITKSVNQ